jgi:hypothetical protein
VTTPRHLLPAVCSILWIGLITVAILFTARRDSTPGDPGTPATDWPAATALRPLRDGWTLVMQAHAQCPCTPSSLDELERLLRDAQGQPVRAYVLVVCPEGAGPDFSDGPALERARDLQGANPAVVVVVDADGREAARFGARTSGAVNAYDRAGRLRFAGGLTRSRGHRGDSLGRAALLGLFADPTPDDSRGAAAVFGCPLQQEGS